MWVVAERSEVPKGPGAGEDRTVVLEDERGVWCAAVVDGSTDKSGRIHAGATGGALAAEQVVRTLRRLPPGTAPAAAVAEITADLHRLRARWGIEDDDPLGPSAAAAVALPRQGLVWRVGDVHIGIAHPGGTWRRHDGGKAVDRALAATRAAYLHALLATGATPGDLAADDPGRTVILPVLQRQAALANRPGPYGYGALDGRPVPGRFVDVVPLPPGAHEMVLASDGYLRPDPTLEAAEHLLAESLRTDPLRIGDHPATKGVTPGARSFDDRTYLRLTRTG
ncbi:hypothetical protein [Sphaerisporangium aureirubrum]|uniref:Protein phosphatase 2C domain-containing protein n=1 Tax=Sphaerisporangium aureirubrum TaxID=1544736 RepID=A0ABW1NH14_9ACTN